MKKRIIISAVVIFLFTGIAEAEPDSVVKSLMNDPVSMFDMGLYRMGAHLETRWQEEKCMVSYSWGENRIKIYCSLQGQSLRPDRDTAKKTCEETIESMRTFMYLRYAEFFRHEGFQRTNEPKDLTNKLIGITEVATSMHYDAEKKKNLMMLTCKGSVADSQIYCTDSETIIKK